MADIHGSPADAAQAPQAATPGSAPVPYAGPGQSPEPPPYEAVPGADAGGATALVMADYPAGAVTEHAAAHDVAAGLADAPYCPGALSPVDAAGDPDAGGRDDVAATVAASVASAEARWLEFQGDAVQGGVIGDLMTFPPSPLDPGAGVGNTTPSGGFFDPPRGYGGAQGAPGYEGEAQ